MPRGKPWEETAPGRDREVAAAFGSVLRRERERAALSQGALAERAGLHATTVSMLERGLRQPSLGVTYRLSVALGYPRERLASLTASAARAAEGPGG